MEVVTQRRRENHQRRPERAWVESEAGLILLDESLRPTVFNREAALILGYPQRSPADEASTIYVPLHILEYIRERGTANFSSVSVSFRSGRREYVCRSYLMRTVSKSCVRPSFGLLLQRNWSSVDIVSKLASDFNLTDRERETLVGISMGLSSKELAERMSISPNTVKVHLRLIMAKMGVATRGEIVAKMLEQNFS